jgi:hypothetical protein
MITYPDNYCEGSKEDELDGVRMGSAFEVLIMCLMAYWIDMVLFSS